MKNIKGLNEEVRKIKSLSRKLLKTDRPTDQPSDRETDMRAHREVPLPTRVPFGL